MILLKLHFAGSVLCLLTAIGFEVVFKDTIRKNGWYPEKRAPLWKRVTSNLAFFIPLLNVMATLALIMAVFCPKERLEGLVKEAEAKK